MKKFVSTVLAVSLAQPAFCCDLCAIYTANEARGEAGRGIFGGVSEQFTHFGTVQVEGREVSDPSGQYLDSSISQLFAGYNFSEQIGLQFNLPMIYRAYKRPNSLGGIEYGTESGIGDASLLGTYSPFRSFRRNSSFSTHILAGIKFPTGDSTRIAEELHEVEEPIGPPSGIHGHDLTLGTGSYDGIFGGGAFGRWHRVFMAANVQYAIRSEGDYNYQFANDLTWGGGPGVYLLLTMDYTLALQAVVSGEYKGKDTFESAPAEDTAVTAVYLGPELSFTWGSKISAFLGADIPVSIQNSSLQTVPDYRIRAGLTFHF